MNEKIYKTMGNVGGANLVMGIIIMVTGISAGIMMIINGARLLKNKKRLIA